MEKNTSHLKNVHNNSLSDAAIILKWSFQDCCLQLLHHRWQCVMLYMTYVSLTQIKTTDWFRSLSSTLTVSRINNSHAWHNLSPIYQHVLWYQMHDLLHVTMCAHGVTQLTIGDHTDVVASCSRGNCIDTKFEVNIVVEMLNHWISLLL